MKKLLVLALALLGTAHAATVTVKVTPNITQPATGIVDGYRMYRACGQQTPILVGQVTSGVQVQFQHDTDQGNPFVVTRAFNTVGEGNGNCVELQLVLTTPGPTTTTYVCELDPVEGGTCTPE